MPEVTGRISAVFEVAAGHTRLSDRYHAYPLKIAKTFPFDYGQLGVYVMDASPGMMAGDRYMLDWRFGEYTNVFITNQSYTKVHPARMHDTAASYPCEQTQVLALGRGSYVEYMPEPLMLYNNAILYSNTEIRMAGGSTLIFSDAVCPGRIQRGEMFHYELYQNRLTVTYEGELIFNAKQRIEPAEQKLTAIGGWQDFTHIGSLYVFSERVDVHFNERLRDHMDTQCSDILRGDSGSPMSANTVYYGISRTYKYGLVLSVMGCKIYEVQEFIDMAWQFIRQQLFGNPPMFIRK